LNLMAPVVAGGWFFELPLFLLFRLGTPLIF
jgi:hypothetical protein